MLTSLGIHCTLMSQLQLFNTTIMQNLKSFIKHCEMLKKQSSNKTPDPSLIILLTTLCLFLSFFVTVLTASNMILLTSLIFALLFMSVAELLYNKEKSTINIYAITLNFFANVSLGAASLIAFYKIFNDWDEDDAVLILMTDTHF